MKDVHFSPTHISVALVDGRTITVPLDWYPRLLHASPEERAAWQISGGGYGIHWPALDEDLSTAGLLRGTPAPDRRAPTEVWGAISHPAHPALQLRTQGGGKDGL